MGLIRNKNVVRGLYINNEKINGVIKKEKIVYHVNYYVVKYSIKSEDTIIKLNKGVLNDFDGTILRNFIKEINDMCDSSSDLKIKIIDKKSTLIKSSYLFFNCQNIKSLDLSEMNFYNVIDSSYMFKGCANLLSIIGVLDMFSISNAYNMFSGVNTLHDIKIKNLKCSLDINESSLYDSAIDFILSNVQNVDNKTLFLGPYNYGRANLESINYAVSKGWKVLDVKELNPHD